MAIRKMRVNDDPILRKKTREITEINDRIIELQKDMLDTMYACLLYTSPSPRD